MFTKLPFIYFWRDSRQNKETQRRKETDCFLKASFFQRKQDQILMISTETQDKTYSDFDNSDILIYECLQYLISSLKAGIMSLSFVWLFVHCLFVSLNAHYMCYIYLVEFTPLMGRGNNLRLQVGIREQRVHVASA